MDTSLILPLDMQEQISQHAVDILRRAAEIDAKTGQLVANPNAPAAILLTPDGRTATGGGLSALHDWLLDHGVPMPEIIEADIGFPMYDQIVDAGVDSPALLPDYRDQFERLQVITSQADNSTILVIDSHAHPRMGAPGEDQNETAVSAEEFIALATPENKRVNVEFMPALPMAETGWQAIAVGLHGEERQEIAYAFARRRNASAQRLATEYLPGYDSLDSRDAQIIAMIDMYIRSELDATTRQAFPSLIMSE